MFREYMRGRAIDKQLRSHTMKKLILALVVASQFVIFSGTARAASQIENEGQANGSKDLIRTIDKSIYESLTGPWGC